MLPQTRTLVITPHAALLPEQGEVVFTGGWCLTSETRGLIALKKLSVEVLPYHWDNRQKYHEDYLYLSTVYEACLDRLSCQLDKVHGEKMGSEYWRIVAGPVLYTILCHLLDRWHIARDVLASTGFDRFRWIAYPPYRFTPKLTVDLDPDCHDYNHFLISSALFSLGLDEAKGERVDLNSFKGSSQSLQKSLPVPNQTSKTALRTIGDIARSMLNRVVHSAGLIEHNKVLIINSYLPRVYEVLLNISCRSMPVTQQVACPPMPSADQRMRETLDFTGLGDAPFCKFVAEMLPPLLPIYLLEGYGELSTAWKGARWPHAPVSIFTSNSFQFNEVFQHYAAFQKMQNGSKLVIGQHGGVSGILEWSFGEDHQVSIADKFISWGWNPGGKKIVPGFVLTNAGKRIRNKKDGCILLTTVPMRRYSHKGGAWPVGPQQSEMFLSDQLKFYEGLEPSIADKTILRIHTALDRRFGSGYVDAWMAVFPGVKVDDSRLPIRRALRKTKLFVYTYNSTGYLESLSMNFPTVMFWDPCLFETKPAFTEAMAELERVGVFHRLPQSAAEHINRIWNDLDGWWSSAHVQEARCHFVDHYARSPRAGGLGLIRKILVG